MKRFRRTTAHVADSYAFESKAIAFVPDGVWIPKAIVAIASRFAVPLFIEIRKHCFETPECFPGQRRLARLVGCSLGTVNALTDRFDALGIIKKMHHGRHCLYRFEEGYWRQRKPRHVKQRGSRSQTRTLPNRSRQNPRKSADCSANRTEDITNVVGSVERTPEPEKPKISQRSALSCRAQEDAERRAKRLNLIKTARLWVKASPDLAEDERPHRLMLLDRCEAQVDDWRGRLEADRRAFDLLIARVRARPLDPAVTQSLRQQPQPSDANSIGAILKLQGWFHSKEDGVSEKKIPFCNSHCRS